METQTADVAGPSGVPATGGLNILSSSTARSLSVVKRRKQIPEGLDRGSQGLHSALGRSGAKITGAPAGIRRRCAQSALPMKDTGWAVGDQERFSIRTMAALSGKTREQSKNRPAECLFYECRQRIHRLCVGETGTLLYSNNSGRVWKKQDINLKVQAQCRPCSGSCPTRRI